MLEHGGRVSAAARQFRIPESDWLDISTGIHPHGWQVPALPGGVWRRLPDGDAQLTDAAAAYYGCDRPLAVNGSQAAIGWLPRLRPACRVGVPRLGYQEHAAAWRQWGHQVIALSHEEIDAAVDRVDVLVLIHPNNPTGQRFPKDQLLNWQECLARRGGWLVVDEAFMDATPEQSLAGYSDREGLIVLRSVGKFFGLAGMRLGFVLAHGALCQQLARWIGPWAVSHPALYIGTLALRDRQWQASTRSWLVSRSQQLADLLSRHGLAPAGGTPLFQWVKTSKAAALYNALAEQAVLVRHFSEPASLRFGLPPDNAWSVLDRCLAAAIKQVE